MLAGGWNPEKIYGTSEIERRLENEEFPGTRGDRWLDGSVKGTAPDGRTALYDFNTAQRLVDGRWVAYERRAENAIRLLKDVVDKRSEEHTSELQSLMRISYAVFCLKKKTTT